MADYIYTAEGNPQGFRMGNFIYTMDGTPIGRVLAEKAYRLSGEYVGAVINGMVVDKPGLSTRRLPPIAPPPRMTPGDRPDHRRPLGPTFADVFEFLTEQAPEPEAAL
jgi:hypothetical protein